MTDTKDELSLYNEFVSLLSPEIVLAEEDCKRFLRARKWNVQNAIQMTENWWKWYHTAIPKANGLTPCTILNEICDPNEEIYEQLMPHSNMGEDKYGRPIYWEMTGDISSVFSEVNKLLSMEELVTRHIRQQELMMVRLKYATEKHKKIIDKQVIVMNLKNLSYAIDTTAMSCFKQTLVIDQDYYPERLHCLFMVNAPWFFTTIWSVIKHWIDPVTAEKFHILGSNYLDTLRDYIDDDQIPPELGGSCPNFTWKWPFPHKSGISEKQLLNHYNKANNIPVTEDDNDDNDDELLEETGEIYSVDDNNNKIKSNNLNHTLANYAANHNINNNNSSNSNNNASKNTVLIYFMCWSFFCAIITMLYTLSKNYIDTNNYNNTFLSLHSTNSYIQALICMLVVTLIYFACTIFIYYTLFKYLLSKFQYYYELCG